MEQTQVTKQDGAGQMGDRSPVAAAIVFVLYLLLGPAILMLAAGTVAWPIAWAYIAVIVLGTLGSRWAAWHRDPSVLRERANFARAELVVLGDRLLVLIIGVLGPLGVMALAGLDHRYGPSLTLSATVQWASLGFVALMVVLSVWAMAVNPFFAAVARLQPDRGQTVVQSGPYRWVRHPSYASALLYSLALPLVLGSLWILPPTAFIAVAILIRTSREDRMLQEGLAGYDEYTALVRFRLIPGIW